MPTPYRLPSALNAVVASAAFPNATADTPGAPLLRDFDVHRIHAALEQAGITHQQFADAIGMYRSYLTDLLLGHRVPGELARLRIGYGLRIFAIDEGAVAKLVETAVMPDA